MQQASQLVERMRAAGVHLDVGVYSLLVQGAIWAEDVQGAHSWAHEAIANGIDLPQSTRSKLKLIRWVPRKVHDDSYTTGGLKNLQLEVDPTLESDFGGKRFKGIIKDFVPGRFGYLTCAETHRVFNRDVYLSSQNNTEGFVKGQQVSFKLYLDKTKKFPRAYDLHPC